VMPTTIFVKELSNPPTVNSSKTTAPNNDVNI